MQFKKILVDLFEESVIWEWKHPFISGLFFRILRRDFIGQKKDGLWHSQGIFYVFDRGSSVSAIIHEIDTGTVILVRQYRAGTKNLMVEIPAGMLEENEEPAKAVLREVFEETGYSKFKSMKLLFSLALSPGGYTEISHIFYIQVRSKDKTGTGGGLVEEGEFLEILKIPVKDAISMIYPQHGQLPVITDAKSVVALQWLENQK